MGKNNKRNRKDREYATLLGMSLGETLPERRVEYDPFDPNPGTQNQDCERYTADGALLIEVQDDLDVRKVELAELPSSGSRGRPTKTTDANRYFRWQLDRELEVPGARLDRISRADFRQIRTHRELGRLVDELVQLTGRRNDIIIMALDTEGMIEDRNPVLVQIAAPGITAVIHLHSHGEGDVFKEGYPNRLRELLLLPNVAFAGQGVIKDIRGLAGSLGINASEINNLHIVDTQRLFTLADALSRDGDAVERWLDQRETTAVGEVSLKAFCQFVKPTLILDKSPHHRNHRANFDEKEGCIREATLAYAALDARRTLEAVNDFAELVGVNPSRLAFSASESGQLEDCSFEAALRIFASSHGSAIPDRLPAREELIVARLRENVDRVRERMVAAQKNILKFRAYKKMLMREMKVDRDDEIDVEKATEIEIVAPHPERVFLPAPARTAARAPVAAAAAPPSTSTRSETHPDPDAPRRVATPTPEMAMDVAPVSQPADKPKRGKRMASSDWEECDWQRWSRHVNSREQGDNVVTQVTQVIEGKSGDVDYVRRDDAVLVSSKSAPDLAMSSSSITLSTISSENLPSSSASADVLVLSPSLSDYEEIEILPPKRAKTTQPLSSTPNSSTAFSPILPPPAATPAAEEAGRQPASQRVAEPIQPEVAPVRVAPEARLPASMREDDADLPAPTPRPSDKEIAEAELAKMLNIAYGRLQREEDAKFPEILSSLVVADTAETMKRFRQILGKFRFNHKAKRRMFESAGVMLALLPMDSRRFMYDMLNNNIFGVNRLIVVVRLQYYLVSPLILLSDLMINQDNRDTLARAIKNFPTNEVEGVVKLLAVNAKDPGTVLAAMKEDPCFSSGFDVDVGKLVWSDLKIGDMVKFMCETAGVPIPAEARPLFLRCKLEKQVAMWKRNETEIYDFYQICVYLTENDAEMFRHCFEFVKAVSNPLAKFIAQMRGFQFSPAPDASESVPVCGHNPAMHAMATGKVTVLDDAKSVKEFGVAMAAARHFAVVFRSLAATDFEHAEFVMFRLRGCAFLYSRHHSREFRDEVSAALSRHGQNKNCFVLHIKAATKYLVPEFGAVPGCPVDVAELATQEGHVPTFGGMAKALTGGERCSRGRNCAPTVLPSKFSMLHFDIEASVLYDYAIQRLSLCGVEMADADAEEGSGEGVGGDTRRVRERNDPGEARDGGGRSRSRLR